MDFISGELIVETCLWMMIDLWEIRNKEIHDKDKTKRSKRGKPRQQSVCETYINYRIKPVQVMHSYFYWDVEEEIEHATAAKLEGFITIENEN